MGLNPLGSMHFEARKQDRGPTSRLQNSLTNHAQDGRRPTERERLESVDRPQRNGRRAKRSSLRLDEHLSFYLARNARTTRVTSRINRPTNKSKFTKQFKELTTCIECN